MAWSSTMSTRISLNGMLSGGAALNMGSAGAGRVNQNLEPRPTSLLKPIWPPMSSTRRLPIARPRPVPPNSRVVEESACENCWNSIACRSAAMPTPESVTEQRTGPRHRHPRRQRTLLQ